jgi:uncharacterized protein (TIGR02301 family)
VLGQSHALRQACRGPEDQYWRSRMLALLKLEAPGPDAKAALGRSFNAGFAAARGAYPTCTTRASAEAARLAGRGQALAQALARRAP